MIQILLNSIALEPNRWTSDKVAHFSIEQLLRPIAAAGFHFIELWQYHISRRSQSEITEIQSIAGSLALEFPVIGMYPELHLTGQERQHELFEIERLMKYANRLGAEIIKAFVGVHGSARISDADYQRSIECMQEIMELADSFDLTVTAETHPNTLCDNLEACKKFKHTLGAENLKLCFQPFDFCDTGAAIADYNALAEDVIHVHYQGQKNGIMELLERSDLDYAKLTGALVERGFAGRICIEFVKDCVVDKPENLNIEQVLLNAGQDRDFIVNVLTSLGVVDFAC